MVAADALLDRIEERRIEIAHVEDTTRIGSVRLSIPVVVLYCVFKRYLVSLMVSGAV